MKNLNEMTSKELKELAKELKISNWWNLKKEVLIAKIEDAQGMTEEEKKQIADQKAREDEALAVYKKNWRKYTERYNPLEFIEKFRAGKIKFDVEAAPTEEKPKRKNRTKQAPNTLVETPAPKNPVAIVVPDGEQPTPKRGALIEFDGKSQNICAWAKELGISANTLYGRIYKMGWTVEKAFTTPSRRK